MRSRLSALALICLLASCQKEINFDTGTAPGSGGGSGSTSGLLVKAVAVTGSETQTSLYTYNAQSQLETLTTKGTSGGMSVDSYQKYVRDAAGRIVKVLQKLPDQAGTTSDTSVRIYSYPNATTMNYTYSVSVMGLTAFGFTNTTTDSTVYNYSGGKLISYNSYLSSSFSPGMTMLSSKYDFTYDASDRVTDMKVYTDASNPGGPMTLDAQWKYTYSAGVINNVYISPSAAQNLILNGLPNTTSNSISKLETISANTAPPTNLVITTTYVTGAGNKPVSATAVITNTGQPTQTTNYTFYYQ